MFVRFRRLPIWPVLAVVALWSSFGVALNAQTVTNTFPDDGNAGIGTTTPQAPLEIQTTETTNILWDNGNARLQGSADAILWNRSRFAIMLDANDDQSSEQFQLFKNVTEAPGAAPVINFNLEDGSNSFIGTRGNFGIGTASPSAALHVYDPVGTGPSDHLDLLFDGAAPAHGLAIDSSINGNWAREFKIMTGGSGTLFGFGALVNNGTTLARGYIGGNSTQDSVYDIPWMTFLPDGKVGIGLLTPASQLAVAGTVESTTGGFQFPDGTIQTTAATSGSPAYGASGSAPVNTVYISNYGYVGIGVPTPGSKLSVYGNVESTFGGFTFPDGTVQTTAAVSGSQNSLDAADGLPANAVYVDGAGNVGIGTTAPLTSLDVRGTTTTYTLEVTGGADLSESFDVGAEEKIVPGMVVAIDPDRAGGLRLSHKEYDRMVAGVVSGAGGVDPGLVMGQKGTVASGGHPIALTGRVFVMANTSNGPIRPGDLLTTSSVPGYAMRVVDHDRADGAILGKAMTGLDEGQGQILVLVTLQ